jgi:hypothetical protein
VGALPLVQRRLDPVLRADGVERDRGGAQPRAGQLRVEETQVRAQGRHGGLHRVVDAGADLQALRVAPDQLTPVVETLVTLDVPPLALDPLVADAQVRVVGPVLGQGVDHGLQVVERGGGVVGEPAADVDERDLVLDAVPERTVPHRPTSPCRRRTARRE